MGLELWPSLQKFSGTPREEKNNKEIQEDREQSDLHKRARRQFANIFDKLNDPNERMTEILERVEPFFQYIDKTVFSEEKADEVRASLSACKDISDKEQFLDKVMEVLEPFLKIREIYPDKFEEAQARAMNQSGGFTEINRLLSYGKSGPVVHIHAPAGMSVGNKITLYREGLRKLAEVVNNDPEIKEINATSFLVADHQSLFRRAGFNIEDVSDEFRREHFNGEEREIKMAKIDREEFLKRFLKQ